MSPNVPKCPQKLSPNVVAIARPLFYNGHREVKPMEKYARIMVRLTDAELLRVSQEAAKHLRTAKDQMRWYVLQGLAAAADKEPKPVPTDKHAEIIPT